MNQSQDLQEIMQRIRAQVRDPGKSTPKNQESAGPKDAQVAEILERLRLQKGSGAQQSVALGAKDAANEPGCAPFTLTLHELRQLQIEINTALEGTRRVGQINPRNPGLINNAIQLWKKVMRRTLTWYTRPLHLFQGAVIRALEQIFAILDNHNDSLRKVAREFATHTDLMGWISEKIRQQNASLEALKLTMGAIEQRTAAIDDKTMALDEKTAALHEKTAALHEKTMALDEKTMALDEKTMALEQRFREASTGFEAKLNHALSGYSRKSRA